MTPGPTARTNSRSRISDLLWDALVRQLCKAPSIAGLVMLAMLGLAAAPNRAAAQDGFGLAAPVPFGSGMHSFRTNFDTVAVTVETWIRVNEFNANHGEPVQYQGGNGSPWYFYLEDAGSLRMRASFFVGGTAASSGPILTRGAWHHLAGTYDTELVRLYVDGVLVAQAPRTAGIPGAGSNPRILCSVKMRCDLDDLRIWNVARRADQIQCSKNSPFGSVLPTNLMAYWTFDNGTLVRGNTTFWEFPSLTSNDRSQLLQLSVADLIPSGATFSSPPIMTLTLDGPTTQTTAINNPVVFSTTALGITPATYGWQVASDSDPSGWVFLTDGVVDLPGLPRFAVAGSHAAGMQVTPFQTTSNPLRFRPTAGAECFYAFGPVATLNVACALTAPTVTLAAPVHQFVAIGQSASHHVDASGIGTFEFRWEMPDAFAPGGWQPLTDGLVSAEGSVRGVVTGANTATMTFTLYASVPSTHTFRCRVTATSAGCMASSLSDTGTIARCSFSDGITLDSPPFQTVVRGAVATAYGSRPGPGPYDYRWEVYEASYPGGNWRPLNDGLQTVIGTGSFTFDATGATTPVLSIQPLGPGPETGLFRLTATSRGSNASPCTTSYSTVASISSCTATPAFLVQPDPAQGCTNEVTHFVCTIADIGPFVYRWQWQRAGVGGPWTDLLAGNNSEAGGAQILFASNVDTPSLDVYPLNGYARFAPRAFRCIATNACGSAITVPATLTTCPGDFNCDGFLDFFDYDDFVNCFETQVCGNGSADINGDAFVDFFDYDDFVSAFEGGC